MVFVLVGIASFFGVIAGYLLAIISPEELEPGKRYLQFFQNLLLLTLLIMFLAFSKVYFLLTVAASLFLLGALWLVTEMKKEQDLHKVLFVMTPLLIFFSSGTLLRVTAALIFLYGMPTASLFVGSRKRLSKTRQFGAVMEQYGIFLLLVLILAILA